MSLEPPADCFHWHRAFGISIQSNRPLPGLGRCAPSARLDLKVHLQADGGFPRQELLYRSPYLDESGEPILTVHRSAQDGFQFSYGDGTHFYVSRTGSEVFATWPDHLTLEDALTYLYGPILGFVLRLRGTVTLHGSGVVVDGQGIALIGPPGAGKSTTAAAFARAGFRVLTDDVFVLVDEQDRFGVQPAYPGIRLWPESVENLWGAADALPQVTPTWDKRYLDLQQGGYEFDGRPVPLAAIYVMGERSAAADAPHFGSPPVFLDLLRNTYAGYVLSAELRAREFDLLTRLMDTVTVRRVIPHANFDELPGLCRLIQQDVKALALT